MGPVAMLRPPPGASSQTQPDGRSAYSVFPFRLGQRGIAPLGAHPLDEPRSQVQLAGGHLLDAVRVQQRLRVRAEHPYSSVHVRMNMGARMKLPIKDL